MTSHSWKPPVARSGYQLDPGFSAGSKSSLRAHGVGEDAILTAAEADEARRRAQWGWQGTLHDPSCASLDIVSPGECDC